MYSSKITTVRLVKMSVSNTILLNSIQLPFFIYSIRVNDNVITYFYLHTSNIEGRSSYATILIPPYYNRITIHIIKMTIIAILRAYIEHKNSIRSKYGACKKYFFTLIIKLSICGIFHHNHHFKLF